MRMSRRAPGNARCLTRPGKGGVFVTAMRREWVAAVTALGGGPEPAELCAAELYQRYNEPHRRYHDHAHVESTLGAAHLLATELGLRPEERAVLVLAVCAHDVVYDARPGDDERASADWARARLTLCNVPVGDIDRVEATILATTTHTIQTDDDAIALLLDADLAVLATPPAQYDVYVDGVRAEYAHLDDDAWRRGRREVLTRLLGRGRIYATEGGRRRWEDRARENMTRELARLSSA